MSTTLKLPFKRFVAQVSTGEPRPKSSYLALMAENLEALDNKIDAPSVADGSYTSSVVTVNANIKALDTQLKTTADGLESEISSRTTAVSNEAASRMAADEALDARIGTAPVNGNYI